MKEEQPFQAAAEQQILGQPYSQAESVNRTGSGLRPCFSAFFLRIHKENRLYRTLLNNLRKSRMIEKLKKKKN